MAVDGNEVFDAEFDSPDEQDDYERRTANYELPLWLAWEGWRMRVPADWRPHKIECVKKRHHMMLGPADFAAAKVAWWRPTDEQTSGRPRPRPKRETELTTGAAEDLGGEPLGGESFDQRDALAAAGEFRGAGKSFWFGYAPRANLVLQVVVNEGLEPETREAIRDLCLPSLAATGPDEPTRWAVFSVSFVSPPGFQRAAHRIEPGHMALRFARGKDNLICRQIYPATLALGHRKLARWLRIRSFAERRTFLPASDPVDWQFTVGGRRLDGLLQVASKQFGAPFGRFGRRWVVSAAALDESLDRILMAEFDSPSEPDETEVTEAIASMNWALPPTGGGDDF